jgi:hypothetical protein
MAFKFERVPNEPIVVGIMTNPHLPVEDTEGLSKELNQVLSEIPGTVYYIADMSKLSVSFADLTVGLAQAYRTPGSPYANPRLKTFPVGSASMIKFGVEAASKQENYGKQQIQLYSSVEEAMNVARGEIAKATEAN